MSLALAFALASPSGFCAGPAWIRLAPGEKVAREPARDATVFNVARRGARRWSVYVGATPYTAEDVGAPLMTRDRVLVRRATAPAEFEGYLARPAGGPAYHFFGRVFADSPRDRAFFGRVTFASPRCRTAPAR